MRDLLNEQQLVQEKARNAKQSPTKQGSVKQDKDYTSQSHQNLMMKKTVRYAFIPDNRKGAAEGSYRIAQVMAETDEFITAQCVINSDGSVPDLLTESLEEVFPAKAVHSCPSNLARDPNAHYRDCCTMSGLSEVSVLENVRCRFGKERYYTLVSHILVAVNPCQQLDIYGPNTVKEYKGKSLGAVEPHIFGMADKTLRSLRSGKSQSILVGGESGSGKTENTKFLIRYLAMVGHDGHNGSLGDITAMIEQRILAANPFIEAFGNAKTVRNHNSSRFGKFVELRFDAKTHKHMAGARINHYLLEKSRVTNPPETDRNYHIFYELVCGAGGGLREMLGLTKVEDYAYLNYGVGEWDIKERNDKAMLQCTIESMKGAGISDNDATCIFRLIALILHLGNIKFTTNSSNRTLPLNDCKPIVSRLAGWLELTDQDIIKALCHKEIKRSGETITKNLKIGEAQAMRDNLAKSLYTALFDWILSEVNQLCAGSTMDLTKNNTAGDCYIGILDVAGFESFLQNSFEQLCINYSNEKLQAFYNDVVLLEEEKLYQSEGLAYRGISYERNDDLIAILETPVSGIFAMLEEEGRLPGGTDVVFTQKVIKNHCNGSNRQARTARLQLARTAYAHGQNMSKEQKRLSREVTDDQGFMIRHQACDVVYSTTGFLKKNNDAVSEDLMHMLKTSKWEFIGRIMDAAEAVNAEHMAVDSSDSVKASASGTAVGSTNTRNRSHVPTVSTRFVGQLRVLLHKLKSTETAFVRCVKPNMNILTGHFDAPFVHEQLRYSGLYQTVSLLQAGYPTRIPYTVFQKFVGGHLPAALAAMDQNTFCRSICEYVGLKAEEYDLGTTMAFFRAGKFTEFDRIMQATDEEARAMVHDMVRIIARNRWKKCLRTVRALRRIAAMVAQRQAVRRELQAYSRGFLIRMEFERAMQSLRETRAMRNECASKIQACWHGHKIRKVICPIIRERLHTLRVKTEATVILQKHWRATIARRHYSVILDATHQWDAALRIQCAWRVHVARRVARSVRRERDGPRAAVVVQKYWRGYHTRQVYELFVQQTLAVTAFQKIWRGRQCRVHRYPHICDILEQRRIQRHEAASLIQAMYRGYRYRSSQEFKIYHQRTLIRAKARRNNEHHGLHGRKVTESQELTYTHMEVQGQKQMLVAELRGMGLSEGPLQAVMQQHTTDPERDLKQLILLKQLHQKMLATKQLLELEKQIARATTADNGHHPVRTVQRRLSVRRESDCYNPSLTLVRDDSGFGSESDGANRDSIQEKEKMLLHSYCQIPEHEEAEVDEVRFDSEDEDTLNYGEPETYMDIDDLIVPTVCVRTAADDHTFQDALLHRQLHMMNSSTQSSDEAFDEERQEEGQRGPKQAPFSIMADERRNDERGNTRSKKSVAWSQELTSQVCLRDLDDPNSYGGSARPCRPHCVVLISPLRKCNP
eukprot:Clim_evm18s243 gene=Clim_evmTU18s243